ncbi:PREDICTED: uncharacterized protein KIAA1109-like, partial [Priapulus caudatus]|uniref:Uncharacterized protein KIAA1109-like n=1 Tax=Priapulus caudatus TaxID=37621 RepID=A0ABM1F344_PRICU
MSWDPLNVTHGELEGSFPWLLFSLVISIIWYLYLIYYNSRVLGMILTKVLNRLYKTGHIQIGSFSMAILSGKIMFRDVHFISEDLTVRVLDGFAVFHWWRPYVRKEITEDMSHSDTRLYVEMNSAECHVYNRSALYSKLEQIFGLDSNMIPPDKLQEYEANEKKREQAKLEIETTGLQWRDLIPVVKIEIFAGRLVAGNHLVPTALCVNVDEAHLLYTTKPASSPLDRFRHFVDGKLENLRVMLAPSPKYTGTSDEPPRYMGEGFVVLSSSEMQVYYTVDEPGLVPDEPEMLELASGEKIETPPPYWGLEVKTGKGTNFSYGPWADRQREHLYNLFYPAEYQPIPVTVKPQPGELRQPVSFDIQISCLDDATIDILFTKNKETNALHLNMGPGSYIEWSVPWVISVDGYTAVIDGQLLHMDTSTSLEYRNFIQAETLEFQVKAKYPRFWNLHQDWVCDLKGSKITGWLLYHHKKFFCDMIDDWSSKSRPDLLHFVPYTWHIGMILKEFEIVVLVNEWNWIDCSSQQPENCHLAVIGELFDVSFNLPFIDFLPPSVPLVFWIQGESMTACLYLPESNTSRDQVLALDRHAKLTNRDGSIMDDWLENKHWRSVTVHSAGWVDCVRAPIVALSITYTYWPIAPHSNGPAFELDLTTPEKEEEILLAMRPEGAGSGARRRHYPNASEFDVTTLAPDVIAVECEIGPAVLKLYGSLLRLVLHLKENYLGEDQVYTDMSHTWTSEPPEPHADSEFDPRWYRPLEVTVTLMGTHADTLHISCKREKGEEHLGTGHVAVSGMQVRGHAMFSAEGNSLDAETLEYAWLVEVQVGDITGRLTAPQLASLVTALNTLVYLVLDRENVLQHPRAYKLCQHAVPQRACTRNPAAPLPCPTADDVKYRLTRLAVDSLELFLVEAGSALNLQLFPVRLSTCNLHSKVTSAGVTALVQHIHLKQYILSKVPSTNAPPPQK